MLARQVAALLLLAGCGDLVGPTETPLPRSPAIAAAEAWADSCAQTPPRHARIAYFTVPGQSFWIEGQEVVGYGRAGRVTVAEAYRDAVPLLAHELLHARYGWPGGLNGQRHDARFQGCGLWPL